MVAANGKGFMLYGYMKNLRLASILLLIKGNLLKIFSKAYIV
jgi:hypothetical protein